MPIDNAQPYGGDVRHRISVVTDFGTGQAATTDITPQVIEFNIFESIFENTMSCNISVADAAGGLLHGAVASGQEIIVINMAGGSGGSRNYAFRLYKIEYATPLQERLYSYVIHGVSGVLEKSVNTPVFNYYDGLTGSEIVTQLYDEHLSNALGNRKSIQAETSSNLLTYTGAGHSPLEFINMVAKDTQSETYADSSAFVFYEDFTSFHFKTINSLLEQNPIEEYYFADPGTSRGSESKNYIAGITWHNAVDSLRGLQSGLYDNTVAAIDPITKTFKEYYFNYGKDFSKLTHISGGGKSLIRPKSFGGAALGDALTGSSHVRFIETDFNVDIENQTIDDRITETNDSHKFHAKNTHNFLPGKVALISSLQQNRIDITTTLTPGVRAGTVVRIFLPSNDGEGNIGEAYFRQFGQRNPTFLVLEHVITYDGTFGQTYSTLKVSKESLGQSIGGPPGAAPDELTPPEAQTYESLPDPSGQNRGENQEQTLEEAQASVDGQLLSDEDGNQGLPYSTLTPLEKQYAIEQGYADADTYPDGTFE